MYYKLQVENKRSRHIESNLGKNKNEGENKFLIDSYREVKFIKGNQIVSNN